MKAFRLIRSLGVCVPLATCIALPAYARPRILEHEAPVMVSSANYRESSETELRRAINAKPVELAELPSPITEAGTDAAPAEPVYFIFAPGQGNADEMTYEDVCALLTPALAQRGFLNAADPQSRLLRPMTDVSLVLRVSYGTTRWRLPLARTEQLAWRDGLRVRPKGSSLFGDVVFDYRAGGASLAELTSVGGASPKLERALEEVGETTYQHLICVDAFAYAELQEKGDSAGRVWTTFVGAPARQGSTFAAFAPMLVRAGAPTFGQTSQGLRIYPDVRVQVQIGEATVVED